MEQTVLKDLQVIADRLYKFAQEIFEVFKEVVDKIFGKEEIEDVQIQTYNSSSQIWKHYIKYILIIKTYPPRVREIYKPFYREEKISYLASYDVFTLT